MSLLKALGLPATPAASRGVPVGRDKGDNKQSTVLIWNRTNSDLRLLEMKLEFGTARFAKAPAPVIAAGDQTTFRVVEPTSVLRTHGSLKYHFERKRFQVDISYVWAGDIYEVVYEGKAPLHDRTRRTMSIEEGIAYEFYQHEHESPEEDPLQFQVKVKNGSGFHMALQSFELEDKEHTEFARKPPPLIKREGLFVVQALDEEQRDGAGNVVYRIERPDKPHLARLRWRRAEGAQPVGTLDPDDGAFAIEAREVGDLFVFDVQPHSGPPTPRGPIKVTILNKAGFAMKLWGQVLHNEKARFVTEPAPTIEGSGRRSVFSVEAPDPDFSKTDGDAHYTFEIPSAGDPAKLEQHAVHMIWFADKPSTCEIDPPAEGVGVEPGGTPTDVVFTVTGPELDFKPPEKVKQPTLRFGDKGADGWVEYLQEALNDHGANLPVTGNFLGETLKAVKAFQRGFKDQGVLEDGVVGDETWSLLREGKKEKPKTDGRQPHSYKEKGLEARWMREKFVCRYDPEKDAFVMQAISVGDTDQLEGRRVRIQVTEPFGLKLVLERSLGPGQPTSKTTQGFIHDVLVEEVTTLFDAQATGGPPGGDYRVEAYFDKELGNDNFNDVVNVPDPPAKG